MWQNFQNNKKILLDWQILRCFVTFLHVFSSFFWRFLFILLILQTDNKKSVGFNRKRECLGVPWERQKNAPSKGWSYCYNTRSWNCFITCWEIRRTSSKKGKKNNTMDFEPILLDVWSIWKFKVLLAMDYSTWDDILRLVRIQFNSLSKFI